MEPCSYISTFPHTPLPTYTPTHTPTHTPTYTPTYTPTHTPTHTPTLTYSQQTATLEQERLKSGDLLVIEEGKLPPKVCGCVGVWGGDACVCAFDDISSPPYHLPPNTLTRTHTHTHTQGFIRLAVFLYSPAAASPQISTTTNEGMLSWNTESLEGKPTALLVDY